MENKQVKKLCIDLAMAESEDEAISILKNNGFWDKLDYWKDYDNNPNNFSTIGNQQSNADSALVEKIINSVDAILMRECYRKGINPSDSQAPKSILEALSRFFGIFDGKLSNMDAKERTDIAKIYY